MAEVLISPDRRSVAIRSAYADDGDMAFGVMHDRHGGHWSPRAALEDWTPLDERVST
jgi:hypothetical protein